MHNLGGVDTFPETIAFIDDSDPPNATNFDAATEALLDRTRYLKRNSDFVRQMAALTWPYPSNPSHTGATEQCGCPDKNRARWYVAETNSGLSATQVSYTEDSGRTWLGFGTVNFLSLPDPLQAIVSRPSDGRLVLATNAGTWWSDVAGGSGTTWTASSTANTTTQHAALCVLGTNFIFASNSAATGKLRTSADGDTWTSHDTVLSGRLATGNDVLLASSATAALCFPCKVGVRTYFRSTDGATWVEKTAPVFDASETFQSVSYDAQKATWWVLTMSSGVGTGSPKIYKSTDDGNTFTLTGNPGIVTGGMRMAASNGVLVATYFKTGVGTRLVVSVDEGATWRFSNGWQCPGTILPFVLCSGDQFCTVSDTNVAISASSGIPSVIVS